jgi:hypothetical protein
MKQPPSCVVTISGKEATARIVFGQFHCRRSAGTCWIGKAKSDNDGLTARGCEFPRSATCLVPPIHGVAILAETATRLKI